MTEEEKLYQLIRSGALENIELALSIAESNKIDLNLEPFENMYSWLVKNNNLSSGNYSLSQKLVKIFAIKRLRLYKIDLELDQIHTFLGHLFQLEELDFRDNSLLIVPIEICQLKDLTYLILSQNLFKELPPSFSKMKKLATIYLNNNRLESIPKELFELPNLRFLSLSYNQIKNCNCEWEKMINLNDLYLNSNKLDKISDQIARLTNLTFINFSNNRIKKIPESFFNLTNLTEFNGHNNQITEIPTEISKLTELTKINLNGNALETVPDELLNLPKLRELDLSKNAFSEEEKQRIKTIANKKSLRTLNI